jgi:soluble lytic murein transglycosylase
MAIDRTTITGAATESTRARFALAKLWGLWYFTSMLRRWWLHGLAVFITLDSLIGWFWYENWRDHRYDRQILSAARQYKVEPALVKAVVWKESRFNARALGAAKETGLMQIRAAAAQEWAKAEKIRWFHPLLLQDPAANTQAGAWYLAKMLKRYAQTDNPIVYALADYNAGRSNVLRWNRGIAATNSLAFLAQMDFPSTRQYIAAITERHAWYQTRFP